MCAPSEEPRRKIFACEYKSNRFLPWGTCGNSALRLPEMQSTVSRCSACHLEHCVIDKDPETFKTYNLTRVCKHQLLAVHRSAACHVSRVHPARLILQAHMPAHSENQRPSSFSHKRASEHVLCRAACLLVEAQRMPDLSN